MRRALVLLTLTALARPATAVEKFDLAVYHFNIQYVQGGLKGWPDGTNADPSFDLNDQQVMDRLIDQSFEPLLDMYARHPTWGADIELQGYLLEVMQHDRSKVLAKLKALADAGRVSVDSFHYADQFWLAFPTRDEEESYDLTLDAFSATGIPHGTTVFTQEGQWGPAMAPFMKARGLSTALLPTNLFGWVYPNDPGKPLYRFGDVYCVLTRGTSDGEVQTQWTFADDGEKAMTGGTDPYLGLNFKTNPDAAAAYEQQLENDEANGWKLVSVADYVKRALELEPDPPPLPPMIDGTWQPKETDNVARWMGDAGLTDALIPGTEADNAVLAGDAAAGRLVREAETVADSLHDQSMQAAVTSAWKDLLLAEGSDATGWNPWMAEKNFALAHAKTATAEANQVLESSAVASRLKPARVLPPLVDATAPLGATPEIAATGNGDSTPSRTATVTWKRRQGTNVWDLTVAFSAAKGARTIGLAFPRTIDDLVVSQALDEDHVVDFPLANIAAHNGTDPPQPVTAALPNGLIALGTNTFLILDTSSVHLCARLPKDEEVVRFTDATAPPDPVTWHFEVLQGTSAEALAEATALNVAPAAVLGPEVGGCGCGGFGDAVALLPLALVLLRRRRREGAS